MPLLNKLLFTTMKIPTKLNLCPIIESVFEIRFDSVLDANIVFALIYGKLKDDFPRVETLPLSELPASMRDADPNLKYQPAYKLHYKDNENIVLQISAKAVGFSFSPEYCGWNDFSSFVIRYLNKIKEIGVISRVIRIGFRVINFIEGNVFDGEKINLKISLKDEEIPYKETSIKTIFSDGDCHSITMIFNEAQLKSVAPTKKGSVIDIDTFSVNCKNFFEDASSYLENVHSAEKKVFFNLLTENYLKSMQPIYE